MCDVDLAVHEPEVQVVQAHGAEIAPADAPERELVAFARPLDRPDVFESLRRLSDALHQRVLERSRLVRRRRRVGFVVVVPLCTAGHR